MRCFTCLTEKHNLWNVSLVCEWYLSPTTKIMFPNVFFKKRMKHSTLPEGCFHHEINPLNIENVFLWKHDMKVMKFVISMASYNIGQVQYSATCMTNYILGTILEYHKRYNNSNTKNMKVY